MSNTLLVLFDYQAFDDFGAFVEGCVSTYQHQFNSSEEEAVLFTEALKGHLAGRRRRQLEDEEWVSDTIIDILFCEPGYERFRSSHVACANDCDALSIFTHWVSHKCMGYLRI